jgi:hypothetical protein
VVSVLINRKEVSGNHLLSHFTAKLKKVKVTVPLQVPGVPVQILLAVPPTRLVRRQITLAALHDAGLLLAGYHTHKG